jgi:hypothetical protein
MSAGCEQRATVDAIDGWTPDESVGPEFIGAMSRRVQRRCSVSAAMLLRLTRPDG